MTNFAKLPTWADKSCVHAVVETPRGSRAKLEFDPKLRVFTLSKPLLIGLTILMTGVLYPPQRLMMAIRPTFSSFMTRRHTRVWYYAVGQSACWRSCKQRRGKRSAMTESLWCPIARHSKLILPTYADFHVAP
jgi:hypothetical protein